MNNIRSPALKVLFILQKKHERRQEDMEKILEYIKYFIMTLGAGLTWLFGAWDIPIIFLIVAMALDYISGLLKAKFNKELSSDVGLKGIARKFLILAIVMIAVLLDRLLSTGTWVFRSLACYFYIANEALSILENSVALGLKVPDNLKNALIQLQEGNKEKKE